MSLALALLIPAAPASAQSQLNFEEWAGIVGGTPSYGGTEGAWYWYGGLLLSDFYSVSDPENPGQLSSWVNGVVEPRIYAPDGAFNLYSLDLAGSDLGVGSPEVGGAQVTIFGYRGGQLLSFDDNQGGTVYTANYIGGTLAYHVEFTATDSWQPYDLNFEDVNYVFASFAQPQPGTPEAAFIDNVRYSATPEPLSLVLVGSGLAGLAALRRRRQPRGSSAQATEMP
jgi:hypothetical protein